MSSITSTSERTSQARSWSSRHWHVGVFSGDGSLLHGQVEYDNPHSAIYAYVGLVQQIYRDIVPPGYSDAAMMAFQHAIDSGETGFIIASGGSVMRVALIDCHHTNGCLTRSKN